MDDVDGFGGRRQRLQPREQLGGIGVDGESMVDDHLGVNRDLAAEHLEFCCAFGQLTPSRADGLVAGQDHGVSRVR